MVWYDSAESVLRTEILCDSTNDAVDFVKLAEAMGAEGIRATTQEEFKSAFEKAMNLGRPVVIDCQIDSDDKVWPMVAPGAAIK